MRYRMRPESRRSLRKKTCGERTGHWLVTENDISHRHCPRRRCSCFKARPSVDGFGEPAQPSHKLHPFLTEVKARTSTECFQEAGLCAAAPRGAATKAASNGTPTSSSRTGSASPNEGLFGDVAFRSWSLWQRAAEVWLSERKRGATPAAEESGPGRIRHRWSHSAQLSSDRARWLFGDTTGVTSQGTANLAVCDLIPHPVPGQQDRIGRLLQPLAGRP
ncbi:hypothetical protein QBC34DRAFT_154341 [Podospora aff. communis PSN243]|uniref:Uncharacterized protein n=1 Tax=Podospora aff. communis PSN243 TaxID=3040156 RepID=A0AAV9GBV0_9PEZI|nr:hypothetical protein QBC34DRAFT_154341 [Podospora aff. communis PSN243]